MRKSYKQLSKLDTFKDRFEYLKLQGVVGEETFGYNRHYNQQLYKSQRWLDVRDEVIIRDEGCDLGVPGYEIYDALIVHHINPITLEDVLSNSDKIYDLNNLITTRLKTHNAIHYGGKCSDGIPIERKPNDTIPWKK